MSRTPLEQMVFEALQCCPEVWRREFPNELVPTGSWETYTRCIAFQLGAVYPDSTWDRPEMRRWTADIEAVRTTLTDTAALAGYSAYAALPHALTALEQLVVPDHRGVA
jgi:hypothetical protein